MTIRVAVTPARNEVNNLPRLAESLAPRPFRSIGG